MSPIKIAETRSRRLNGSRVNCAPPRIASPSLRVKWKPVAKMPSERSSGSIGSLAKPKIASSSRTPDAEAPGARDEKAPASDEIGRGSTLYATASELKLQHR